MLPVSSAYFEPRICASHRTACSPAHASLSAVLASAGLSASSAAAAVSPVASAAKNFSAVGSGPLCCGVHALSVAATAATVSRLAARDAVESHVAIGADVRSVAAVRRVGTPRSNRDTCASCAETHVWARKCEREARNVDFDDYDPAAGARTTSG